MIFLGALYEHDTKFWRTRRQSWDRKNMNKTHIWSREEVKSDDKTVFPDFSSILNSFQCKRRRLWSEKKVQSVLETSDADNKSINE